MFAMYELQCFSITKLPTFSLNPIITSMHSKSNITYLLNPAVQVKASMKSYHTPDQTGADAATMSLFRSLAPVSPQAATSSLQYRWQILSSIAPYEKKRDLIQYLGSKKAGLSLMTLAALSMATSSSKPSSIAPSSSDSVSSGASSPQGKTRTRKTHTPPCQVEGCKNLAVSRGCCVRHGGGSKCTEPGCNKRAKLYQRCFQHGGFKTCTEPGCTKKAKRYGHCWSHGGGHICEFPECTKVSTQGGLCWAHGGGNRCKQEGCNRRSYQKYDYYCIRHAVRSSESSS